MFRNQPGGFVRVKYLGLRKNDRAKMASIEYIGNPMELNEKSLELEHKQKLGLQSFWHWEKKILKQEIEYYQNLVSEVENQISKETEEVLTSKGVESPAVQGFNEQIRKEIELKYETKKKFL